MGNLEELTIAIWILTGIGVAVMLVGIIKNAVKFKMVKHDPEKEIKEQKQSLERQKKLFKPGEYKTISVQKIKNPTNIDTISKISINNKQKTEAEKEAIRQQMEAMKKKLS